MGAPPIIYTDSDQNNPFQTILKISSDRNPELLHNKPPDLCHWYMFTTLED